MAQWSGSVRDDVMDKVSRIDLNRSAVSWRLAILVLLVILDSLSVSPPIERECNVVWSKWRELVV